MLAAFVKAFAILVASMRPEHGCSGNGIVAYPAFMISSGFNEAGARMLRKWSAVFWASGTDGQASMRPEHGCSGNGPALYARRRRHHSASMRPEHGCSGNVDFRKHKQRIIGLLQ